MWAFPAHLRALRPPGVAAFTEAVRAVIDVNVDHALATRSWVGLVILLGSGLGFTFPAGSGGTAAP